MGLLDKFKKIFVAPDDYYEEDIDVAEEPRREREPVAEVPRRTTRSSEPSMMSSSSSSIPPNGNYEHKAKVVSMHGESKLKISLETPTQYDEVKKIADKIKDGYTIVLNIEGVDSALKRRFGDFMAGAAYVTSGNMSPASDGVYVITPENVSVDGDLLNDIGTKMKFF